ncbi:MAG: sulfotransferase [Desulfobacteraceae bacterium]|nr:sulfotransferase [Desulfobacteraceae bacterium]MBC2756087.1 sulfotransferase [Desulfobacteraceae bacterium]MBC2763756.1 sulfotransferase [ANME-2 cluster archaeon]
MSFDFKLMLRMYFKSITAYHETGARFTLKRTVLILSFPVWYGFLEITTWICLFLDEIFFPGYRKIDIKKPVFIAGFPRSGTTYLHRVIDNDRQFSSLKMWEIVLAPSIIQKKFFQQLGRLDRMMGKPLYRMVIALENKIFAGSRSMHKISHFEAEEDEIILIHIFSSLFLTFMFPFDEMNQFSRFDTDVSPGRRKKIMNFYKKCVQRHLYVFGPEKHFLSKNPASSSKINSIYETFPDAGIICTVRQPFEALPSAISWVSYGFKQFNTADQAVVTAKILALISHFYTYPLEQLDKRPEVCRIIETYDNLVSEPGAFVKRIYDRFGFTISEEYQRYLDRETEKSKKYQSNHSYSLDQYGLTTEQVVNDFKSIFDRFGFESV